MSQENVEIVRRWMGATVDWMNSGNDREEVEQVADRFTAPGVVY